MMSEKTLFRQATWEMLSIYYGKIAKPRRSIPLLEAAGFADVKIHQATDKLWIAVIGRKSI